MDLAKMRARLAALNNESGTNFADNFWKPEVGKTEIRIIPSALDPDNPFTELMFHSAKGMFKYPVLSLTNFGQQDPIEEFIKELRSTSDRDNWSLSGKISPKPRYFCPVIVRGEEEKGVRLWNIGPGIYKALLSLAADEEIGDFTDIVNGTDMVVEKTAAKTPGSFPEITVRAKRKSSPLSTDAAKVEEWLKAENQPKAIDCFRRFDYDYIKKCLEAYLSGKPVDQVASETTNTSTDTKEAAEPGESKGKVEETRTVDSDTEIVARPSASAPAAAPAAKASKKQKKFEDLFGKEGDVDDLPF